VFANFGQAQITFSTDNVNYFFEIPVDLTFCHFIAINSERGDMKQGELDQKYYKTTSNSQCVIPHAQTFKLKIQDLNPKPQDLIEMSE